MLRGYSACAWICLITWSTSGLLAYSPDETECPHALDDGIFSPEYWVSPGTPYRALRTLPWRLFTIKQSRIANAGLGVFTTTFLPKNTWLPEYDGEFLNSAQAKDVHDYSYAWRVYTDEEVSHYIDGMDDDLSNWLRYINCPRHVTEENVLMSTCYGRIYYRTKVDLPPGAELFVYYGDEYARKELNININRYNDVAYDFLS